MTPTIKRIGNDVEIEFDATAWEIVRNLTVEDVLGTFRTEDVVDRRTGQRTGVRIADTGALAAAFDVQNGDILRSIDGVRVNSREEAVRVVRALPKEAAIVTIGVERNGTERTYRVDPRDPKVRAAANRLRYEK